MESQDDEKHLIKTEKTLHASSMKIKNMEEDLSKTFNELTSELEKLGIPNLYQRKFFDALNNLTYLMHIHRCPVKRCVEPRLQDSSTDRSDARIMPPVRSDGSFDGSTDIVVFGFRDSLAEKYYGIEMKYIQKIIFLEKITKLSNAHNDVKGIIDHEGNLISILDIREELGLDSHNEEKQYLIILNFAKIHAGILVDEVHYALETKQYIQIQITNTKFIKKNIRVDEKTVSLIDTAKILRKIQNEQFKRLK